MSTAIGKVLLGLERAVGGVSPGDPAAMQQVLVLEYQLPLGCCVHLSPLFEALKVCRPDLRIAIATRGLGAAVLRHSPFVDEIVETANPLVDLRGAVRDLRRGLRVRGFKPECVLTGIADQRTRIGLLGMLGASGWRGGFTQMPELYQRRLEANAGLSHIGNNLQLAKLLGCDDSLREPRVYFSAKDAEVAAKLLKQANPAGGPVVAMVTQTSGGQRTGWHTERFVEVIRAAAARGWTVVFPGTVPDEAAIEVIRVAAGGVGMSIAGKTSVTELAAVLAMSDAVVSLDTGTMHVGRAVGVPMVALGPSWQRPLEWMPLGVANVRILRGEDREDIPAAYRLDELEAGSVMAALDDLLAEFPPSGEARAKRVERALSQVDHLVGSG